MSTAAIIMMIVAMVLLWGGLLTSAVHLRRHPETGGTEDEQASPANTAPPRGTA